MEIRKAKIEDLKELRELYHQFLIEDNDGTFDAEWAFTERSTALLREPIEKENGFVYLFEDKGNLAGFIIGWMLEAKESRKEVLPARIDEIYIAKDYRGQGVGKKLAKEFEKWAKIKGANKVKVGSYYDNKAARRLYESLGYKEWVVEYEKDL